MNFNKHFSSLDTRSDYIYVDNNTENNEENLILNENNNNIISTKRH
jgi:hypothetical protein